MKALGYVTATIILMVFAALWSGYALSLLWGWFMVPLFRLPELTINSAIGIGMIVSYMSKNSSVENDDLSLSEKLIKAFSEATAKPLFAIAFGYIVHLFA